MRNSPFELKRDDREASPSGLFLNNIGAHYTMTFGGGITGTSSPFSARRAARG